MSTQVKFTTASNDWCAVDNGAAPSFPTLDITKEHLGYDLTTPQASAYSQANGGSATQAANVFGDTGSTTLDPVNDTVYAIPSVATFAGNGGKGLVLGTAPSFATVSKVLTDPFRATILWKNPA